MYSKEFMEIEEGYWEILDPEGRGIYTIASEYEADSLLSHLNR